jgi:hypothetical protein
VSDSTLRSRSLFQFSVVLTVIGVVAAVFFNALYDIQEQAERTVMEATVRNMNSGLRMDVATRAMHGQEVPVAAFVGANPVKWLENPPPGYIGMCQQELAAGEWCFDAATLEIVYLPRADRHLEHLEPARRGLRWRVGMPGGSTGSAGSTGAIRLFSTTSFVWR